ncbi:hypothetical protein SAMN03080594_10565 [Arenibacter palladensis]|uniref:Uncharacterized protein n=1 Tax=Arenibacter palladensis TaxID=237373 RepID=A0A1M5CIK4_9FLAO|nr:hypothetical protein SAMN03080594_10565 [Arenibacter palladensis]
MPYNIIITFESYRFDKGNPKLIPNKITSWD